MSLLCFLAKNSFPLIFYIRSLHITLHLFAWQGRLVGIWFNNRALYEKGATPVTFFAWLSNDWFSVWKKYCFYCILKHKLDTTNKETITQIKKNNETSYKLLLEDWVLERRKKEVDQSSGKYSVGWGRRLYLMGLQMHFDQTWFLSSIREYWTR